MSYVYREEEKTMLSAEEQLHTIASGAAQIVPESALLEKLKRGTPLNISWASIPLLPISISAMPCRCASCASSRISATA